MGCPKPVNKCQQQTTKMKLKNVKICVHGIMGVAQGKARSGVVGLGKAGGRIIKVWEQVRHLGGAQLAASCSRVGLGFGQVQPPCPRHGHGRQ